MTVFPASDGQTGPPDEPPRHDGRAVDGLRDVTFQMGIQRRATASCLVAFGGTRVLCAASFEEGAPRWRNRQGWVTAEYAMLPGSTSPRPRRESAAGGRSQEIQRLIGRSLRAGVDLRKLPEGTITVDCDVLEADGGTRTAAITGGWVVLARALENLGLSQALTRQVAAVSVGVVGGRPMVDLDYEEDVAAEVDMNVVATADGRLVEVQGTAEGEPFDRNLLDRMIDLAVMGCEQLFEAQRAVLEATPSTPVAGTAGSRAARGGQGRGSPGSRSSASRSPRGR